MPKKHDELAAKQRVSPTATVANISDDFFASLNIPELPAQIPQRLEEALAARVNSLLYHLREAKHEGYVKALEVRLVREAFAAVLTAYVLKLSDATAWYASFKELVTDLGYERADIGFQKPKEE